MKRCFLGIGLIGEGMTIAALKRGETVTVANRTPSKMKKVIDAGAIPADTFAAAVAGQTRVHIALTSDAAVDAVLGQIIDVLEKDAMVIDHSTTSPEGSVRRGELLQKRGLHYLAAPVFMSPKFCEEAKGSILVAGDKAAFEAVEPELSKMTGSVVFVGENLAHAAVYKLTGNALNLVMLTGLTDMFAIAGNHGVSPQEMMRLFDIWTPNGVVTGRGTRMANANFEPMWSLNMARKDVGLMIDAAGERTLTLLPAVAKKMEKGIEAGNGEQDVAIIAEEAHRMFEKKEIKA